MVERILGTTKVQAGWKISLIKAVREILDADKDDIIVFKRIDNKIVIEKG